MKKEFVGFLAFGLAFLFAAVTASAYITNDFEGGSSPSWQFPSKVIVTNNALKHGGTGSLYVPTLSSATNLTGSVSGQKVWTDFYTIPRPFVSDFMKAPATDTNATAQFFVNTNGFWVTISGSGTDICSSVIASSTPYPTVTQYSAFYHVSVLHDYSASNWSLFVNDALIATNKSFICSGVTTHTWFQVQNFGGETTNVCWLDDFMVASRLPSSGNNALTNMVAGTTLPVSDAMVAFGSSADPRPTNETVSVAGAGISLDFGRVVADGRRYVVLATTNFNLSGLSSNGLLNTSGSYTDSVALASATRDYFKLITVSQDGSVILTNEETYAAYKQFRSANKTFFVGVPVGYKKDTDRTMGGAMGTQLAAGLFLGDQLTITTNGIDYIYVVNASGTWDKVGGAGGDAFGEKQWAPGVGMVIKRGATGGATVSYFAGLKETNAVNVGVASNAWTYLTWPHNDKVFNNGTALGFVGNTGDYIYIQTNGVANYIPARFNGVTWKTGLNGFGLDLSLTLQPGDGIIYRPVSSAKVFSSVGP